MAKPINPYESVLASYFPNKTGQEYKQDLKKVTHYLICLNQERPLNQWLNPDPKKLKAGENVEAKVHQRVNTLVTEKKLHPLHLCAMLNRDSMAKMLFDTRVCQIDPQDYCGFTPLHHAAVNNFARLITLLLKHGANANAHNARGGTYSKILELVHPQNNPSKQVCYFKDSDGKIIQGDGFDFQRITGARIFLDKESTISIEETVKEWAQNPPVEEVYPKAILPHLEQAYQQFLQHPPEVYLETRGDVGVNVCAKEDIEPGTVIEQYSGEIRSGSKWATEGQNAYLLEPFDAEEKRGIGACLNDSFPNCASFSLPNSNGLLERVIFCATTRIPKGHSILCNYGAGQAIKLMQHQELNHQDLTSFFSQFTGKDFLSLGIACDKAQEDLSLMTSVNASFHSFDSFNKMIYLVTTPHAMLKLFCDQTLTFDAIQVLCFKLMLCYKLHPNQGKEIQAFISDLAKFSSALKKMTSEQEKQWRNKILENLPQRTVKELRELMQEAR